MAFLKVNDEDLSSYIKTMTIDRETIWNSDAGRGLDGNFIGRIIGEKYKINLTLRPLTQAESAVVHNAIRGSTFLTVKFIPPSKPNDTFVSKTMYVSSPNNEVHSYNPAFIRYSGMTFNLIEV